MEVQRASDGIMGLKVRVGRGTGSGPDPRGS